MARFLKLEFAQFIIDFGNEGWIEMANLLSCSEDPNHFSHWGELSQHCSIQHFIAISSIGLYLQLDNPRLEHLLQFFARNSRLFSIVLKKSRYLLGYHLGVTSIFFRADLEKSRIPAKNCMQKARVAQSSKIVKKREIKCVRVAQKKFDGKNVGAQQFHS